MGQPGFDTATDEIVVAPLRNLHCRMAGNDKRVSG
jgi:hypothetical protein